MGVIQGRGLSPLAHEPVFASYGLLAKSASGATSCDNL